MTKNTSILMEIGQGMSIMLGLPRINYWNNDNRPKNPKRGTFGYNTKTNSLEYFDGDVWMGAKLSKA